jgi:transposase
VEAVIPPINPRSKKLHYDKALYRQRNRIERFFNKVKTSAASPPAATSSRRPFSPLSTSSPLS